MPAATHNEPSNSPSGQISAENVGYLFVKQYYTTLHQNPSNLHRFYKKPSVFTHGEEGVPSQHVSGQSAIHERIQSLGYIDTKVEISQVDSQSSIEGGVMVMVLGVLINSTQPRRRFAQTFFLAADGERKYYVHNDVFRYLKDETEKQSPQHHEDSTPVPDGQEISSSNAAPLPDTVNVSGEETNTPVEATPPAATSVSAPPTSVLPSVEPITTSTQPTAVRPLPTQPNLGPVAQPGSSQAARPRPPNSVRPWGPSHNAVSAPPPTAQPDASIVTDANVTAAPSTTVPTPATEPSTSETSQDQQKPSTQVAIENFVHIGRIKDMTNITEAAVREVFNKIADVKSVQLFLQKNYIHVEFFSADDAQKVLKKGPYKLSGMDVSVEPRRPNTQRSNRARYDDQRGTNRPRDGQRYNQPQQQSQRSGGGNRGSRPPERRTNQN